jgi:serine/threonine-protein kinase
MGPGTVINGKYRIVCVLAHGGMGKIYRAEQMTLGRQVALKILRTRFADEIADDPNFQRRFLLEANILSRLEHANIVRLYDYGRIENREGEQYFMAMELLHGDTLLKRLREHGALPALDVVRIVRHLARGLGAAHKLDVVHRDLKPSNVILVPDEDGETAKILDFGISKILNSGVTELTAAGTFLGSPRYMAPEQVSDGNVDVRTDIYSLGVIMYECLTGRVPFDGETNVGIMMAHCNSAVPPMVERGEGIVVPEALERLAVHCLQKEPALRPHTMDDVLRELAASEVTLSTGRHARVVRIATPSVDTLPEVPAATRSNAPLDATPRTVTRSSTPTMDPPVARKKQRPTLLAALVAIVAIGGIGAAALLRTKGSATESSVSVASSPPRPAVRTSFTLTIESSPARAEVREDGALLGETPLRLTIDRASVGAPRSFTVARDGYAPYTLVQPDSEEDVRVVAALVAVVPDAAIAAAPSARAAASTRASTAPRITSNPDLDIKLKR